MPEYPSPATWEHATERQQLRAHRSFAELRKRSVPVYSGPLLVDDDDEAKVQPADEVARRTLVLWAVVRRAEGVSQRETFGLIKQLDLEKSVSPSEMTFIQKKKPSPDECRAYVWRLECIWVLMWALGHIDQLGWPDAMCDVTRLAKLVKRNEANRTFIDSARLRPTKEILDAQDLTRRVHWAIREAYLRQGGVIPANLDWSPDADYIPVNLSPAVGVVEERHYSLNWLADAANSNNWDNVDTST